MEEYGNFEVTIECIGSHIYTPGSEEMLFNLLKVQYRLAGSLWTINLKVASGVAKLSTAAVGRC
jgi:hypothetical protein